MKLSDVGAGLLGLLFLQAASSAAASAESDRVSYVSPGLLIPKERFRQKELPDDSLARKLGAVVKHVADSENISRELQDPCSGLNTDLLVSVVLPDGSKGSFPWSRYFEDCMSTLPVNSQNMLSHIQSINDVFLQYYCFYDIVKDPDASDPKSHQPELGYSIFGEGEGQVDIIDRLNQTFIDVSANGATAATFWEVAGVFNLLRDAHVSLPQLRPESVANPYFAVLVPARSILNESIAEDEFFFDDNNDIQLKVTWTNPDGTTEEEFVETMDGKSVEQFLTDLVSSPAWFGITQSIGPRINDFLGRADFFRRGFSSSGRPSDLVPPSFVVKYVSGFEETYLTAISSNAFFSLLSTDGTNVALDRETAVASLNAPGNAYLNFERMLGQISDARAAFDTEPAGKRDSNSISSDLDGTRRKLQSANFTFDEVVSLVDLRGNLVDAFAYKIEDDYAILKVQTFLIPAEEMLSVWRDMSLAAKEKGVTKLMIDLSSNGGGLIIAGNSLAVAMFPDMDYSFFEEAYDVTYNAQMIVYNSTIFPLSEILVDAIQGLSDEDLQNVIDILFAEDVNVLDATATALRDFCFENCLSLGSCNVEVCETLDLLVAETTSFIANPTPQEIRELGDTLTLILGTFNPFNVLGENINLDESGRTTVNRGGVEVDLSDLFTIFSQQNYTDAATVAKETGHSFDSYVIVSNGAAGSTSCLFESMVSQLWRNRAESNVASSVVTVTYGGTGDASDMTVTGFPASVQNVHLEYPIIANGALFMLETLLPDNANVTATVMSARELYQSVLPLPPFFGNTLPVMPVLNYYDPFMQPGAIPLQYVKIPTDEYIPELYQNVNLATSTSDLADLYPQAATFFLDGTPPPIEPSTGTPTEPSTEPPVSPSPSTPPPSPTTTTSGASKSVSVVVAVVLGVVSFIAVVL